MYYDAKIKNYFDNINIFVSDAIQIAAKNIPTGIKVR